MKLISLVSFMFFATFAHAIDKGFTSDLKISGSLDSIIHGHTTTGTISIRYYDNIPLRINRIYASVFYNGKKVTTLNMTSSDMGKAICPANTDVTLPISFTPMLDNKEYDIKIMIQYSSQQSRDLKTATILESKMKIVSPAFIYVSFPYLMLYVHIVLLIAAIYYLRRFLKSK